MSLRFRAIQRALADGRRERVRALWARVQELYQYQEPPAGYQLIWMRSVPRHAGEGEWLAEFDQWRKEWAAREVVPLRISWPTVEVLVEQRRQRGLSRGITPSVRAVSIRSGVLTRAPTSIGGASRYRR